jgi:hypothetical protein
MGRTEPTRSMVYEFRVDGRPPENSSEALCGLLVEEVPAGLVLRGAVIDEPHLLGIINQLGVLGLSLVSVRPVAHPGHAAKRSARMPSTAVGAERRTARRLARRAGQRGDRG